MIRKTDSLVATADAVHSDVAAYLDESSRSAGGTLSNLNLWIQRLVREENRAKIELVFEADDPKEHCYQDLVREIDSEAEAGVFLVHKRSPSPLLRGLAEEPGISGDLHRQMARIAPLLFADELSHSDEDLDIVWATIEARFDRAAIEADISKMIMTRLVGEKDHVDDMTDAIRSLLYAFHEHRVRRRCDLPQILNEHSNRELTTMASQLAERAGDYDRRVKAICKRAGTC